MRTLCCNAEDLEPTGQKGELSDFIVSKLHTNRERNIRKDMMDIHCYFPVCSRKFFLWWTSFHSFLSASLFCTLPVHHEHFPNFDVICTKKASTDRLKLQIKSLCSDLDTNLWQKHQRTKLLKFRQDGFEDGPQLSHPPGMKVQEKEEEIMGRPSSV